MHNSNFGEKTSLLHMAKQNHMHFSYKIQQPVRSIEFSEGSSNLMSTIVLKDDIEKKIITFLREF